MGPDSAEVSGLLLFRIASKGVEYLDAKGFKVFHVSGDNDHAVNSGGGGDHRISAQVVGLARHQSRSLAKNCPVRRKNWVVAHDPI